MNMTFGFISLVFNIMCVGLAVLNGDSFWALAGALGIVCSILVMLADGDE